MTDADDHPAPDAPPDADSARLNCPQCGAGYSLRRPMQGRRVRCRHCNHVWRHEPGTVEAVAGALESAAGDWMRLGSTVARQADHASSMGRLVTEAEAPPEPAAAEWVNRKIARYDIKAVLGQGAMGYVYEAYDRELKRLVALKILPHRVEPGREPMGLKMFLQEARVAARLQHPNAVTIYDVGQDDGVYYFAMERVRGVTLRQLVQAHGPLPANQVCYLLANAARALAAAHQIGVVHRDVKPSNVMIDSAGHVKVTDFGLADVAGIDAVPELSARAVGTPGWVSPEVARGEKATPQSDIYSLGLVLYFAMTGDRLVEAASRDDLIRVQRRAQSVMPADLPEAWPPRLRDVCVQCLQADPVHRYQSAEMLAADLLRALFPAVDDDTVVLGSGSGGGDVRTVPSYVSDIVLTLLLVVAVGLALLYWWMER